MNVEARLILYHKPECPLCEEFELELQKWIASNSIIDYELQSINEQESLKRKYEWRVPVLTLGETEVCFAKFDAKALESLLFSNAHLA